MVKEAINRIAWRFKRGNFTPNDKDINAINQIIDWYNDSQKTQFNANPLFAKLYIYVWMKIMDYDKTNVLDKQPGIVTGKHYTNL